MRTCFRTTFNYVLVINKANSEFEKLDFDRLEFAYDEVERVIQSLEQIKFLLNTINELYNSLS